MHAPPAHHACMSTADVKPSTMCPSQLGAGEPPNPRATLGHFGHAAVWTLAHDEDVCRPAGGNAAPKQQQAESQRMQEQQAVWEASPEGFRCELSSPSAALHAPCRAVADAAAGMAPGPMQNTAWLICIHSAAMQVSGACSWPFTVVCPKATITVEARDVLRSYAAAQVAGPEGWPACPADQGGPAAGAGRGGHRCGVRRHRLRQDHPGKLRVPPLAGTLFPSMSLC